jgi:translation initiation factor 1A
MVKNTGGGSKHKKLASKNANFKPKTLYAIKEQGMMYAKVLKKLGGTHMQVSCTNGKVMTAKISGTMRKRKWINIGDIILVSPRTFETSQDQCDILYCYNLDEAKDLLSQGEITFELNKSDEDSHVDFNDDLFEEDSDDDILKEESENSDEIPENTNRKEPVKTGKDVKSRNNKRDEKLSRIENLNYVDEE